MLDHSGFALKIMKRGRSTGVPTRPEYLKNSVLPRSSVRSKVMPGELRRPILEQAKRRKVIRHANGSAGRPTASKGAWDSTNVLVAVQGLERKVSLVPDRSQRPSAARHETQPGPGRHPQGERNAPLRRRAPHNSPSQQRLGDLLEPPGGAGDFTHRAWNDSGGSRG